MRTAQLLLVFLLVWCQTTECLNNKWVNLGANVTLDCQTGIRDIYWIFQKLTESPVVILRTFTSDTTSSLFQDERLKDKYSSLNQSRLFISNITTNELGIYYCAKPGSFLQLSNGTRLYTVESVQDQNHTEYNNHEQPQSDKTPEIHNIVTFASLLLNTVLIIAIIVLLMLKLKKLRKSQQQPQNVETVLLEDLNAAQRRKSHSDKRHLRTSSEAKASEESQILDQHKQKSTHLADYKVVNKDDLVGPQTGDQLTRTRKPSKLGLKTNFPKGSSSIKLQNVNHDTTSVKQEKYMI